MVSTLHLDFITFDVDSDGSIIWAFDQLTGRSGIYWLEFSDGTAYIGQSVHLDHRLATHRRHWTGEIRQVRLAECPLGDLDFAERAMIKQLESEGRSLRNKMLTRRPGGAADVQVTTRQGHTVSLPWDRSRRRRAVAASAPDVRLTQKQAEKYRQLRELDGYHALCRWLGRAIDEIIPDPVRTAPQLCTLTALPSSNRAPGWRRLSTINAGRLEILRIFEEREPDSTPAHWAYLNLDRPGPAERPPLREAMTRCGAEGYEFRYPVDEDAITISVAAEDLGDLLDEDVVANLAYRLVVRHMRIGSNPLRRHHHPGLFRDALLTLRPQDG